MNRRTELRSFQSGDQVLALLPIIGSPFQAKFAGPYTVARKISDLNYLITTPRIGERRLELSCKFVKAFLWF